jgi:hypothetical protein
MRPPAPPAARCRSWCDAITPRKPLRLVAVRVPPRTRTSMPDRVRVGPHGVFRRLRGNGPLLRILAGGARRPMLASERNHERSVLTQPLAHASARRIATTWPAHALACPTRLSKHLGRWLASRAEAPQQAIRAVAVTVPIACRRRRGKEVGPHLWSLVFSRGSDRRRDPSLATDESQGGWAEHFGGCYWSGGRCRAPRSPPVSSVRRAGAISVRFLPEFGQE